MCFVDSQHVQMHRQNKKYRQFKKFAGLSQSQRPILDMVYRAFELLFTMPATYTGRTSSAIKRKNLLKKHYVTESHESSHVTSQPSSLTRQSNHEAIRQWLLSQQVHHIWLFLHSWLHTYETKLNVEVWTNEYNNLHCDNLTTCCSTLIFTSKSYPCFLRQNIQPVTLVYILRP